jgi:transposase
VQVKRKLRRDELLPFFEKQEKGIVVIEACGAGHHWARVLTGLGHDVKLIAPEAVRPFVKKARRTIRLMQRHFARRRVVRTSSSCLSKRQSSRRSWLCIL